MNQILLFLFCVLCCVLQISSTFSLLSADELDHFSLSLKASFPVKKVPLEENVELLSSFEKILGSEEIGTLGLTDVPTEQPTSTPTIQFLYYDLFKFDCVVKVAQVNGQVLYANSLEALKETIASLMGISLSSIGNGRVIDQTRRLIEENMAAEESHRRLGSAPYSSTFVVSFPVTIDLADYPKFKNNATALFDYLEGLMQGKVADKTFENTLKDAALTSGSSQLYEAVVDLIEFVNFYLIHGGTGFTKMPSGAPTSFPTTFPTSFPTTFPTSFPTSFPTTFPTSFPTNFPTSRPSGDADTPPPFEDQTISFKLYMGLTTVSSQSLTSSGQQTIVDTLADITDIPVNQIEYLNLVGDRRRLSSTWDMVAVINIIAHTKDFPQFQGNETKVFQYLKGLLIESYQGENLITSILRKNADIYGNELTAATIIRLSFDEFQLYQETDVPTFSPTVAPTTEGSEMATTFTFDAYFGLSQTSAISLTSSAQSAFFLALADTLDISVNQLEFIGVLDAENNGNGYVNRMVIGVKITISIGNYPEYNGDQAQILAFLKDLLETSVSSEDFQNLVRLDAKGNDYQAVDLYEVVVFKVQYIPFALSGDNNNNNGENNGGNNGGDNGGNNGGDNGGNNGGDNGGNNGGDNGGNNGGDNGGNNGGDNGGNNGGDNGGNNGGDNGGNNGGDNGGNNGGDNGGNNGGDNGGNNGGDNGGNNGGDNGGNNGGNNGGDNGGNNGGDNGGNNGGDGGSSGGDGGNGGNGGNDDDTTTPTSKKSSHKKKQGLTTAQIGMIAGAGVVFVGLLAFAMYYVYSKYKDQNEKDQKQQLPVTSDVEQSAASMHDDAPLQEDLFILNIMDDFGLPNDNAIESVEQTDGSSVFNSLVLTDNVESRF